MTEVQYLALSTLAYSDFTSLVNDKPSIGIIIDQYKNSIKGYRNTATGEINPEFQALSTMLDWTLINASSSSSGFAGAAFQSPSGEIVFAFRGTEPKTTEDISTDFDIFMQDNYGHLANQFSSAESFVSTTLNNPSYSGSTYSFTGHSMGGGLV